MSDDAGQGSQGPLGPQGSEGPIGAKGSEGIEGPAGPKGSQGVPGEAGAQGPSGGQGVEGQRGEVGPPGDRPVTEAYTHALSRRFLKLVLMIEVASVLFTVVFVVVVLGIANRGDEQLSAKLDATRDATLERIDRNANVTLTTAEDSQLEITRHHYFVTCVFLVLTRNAVERTPTESRDIIFKCEDESESKEIGKGWTVDQALNHFHPNLRK